MVVRCGGVMIVRYGRCAGSEVWRGSGKGRCVKKYSWCCDLFIYFSLSV